ncbi:MAG: acetyl-CoA carboxylase carboxyltransferase subunit beta [Sphingobacteriales bacterium]|jgi:acetyl-CoA carboxylase carboxyl transferase subunit beta|nr:acetyl-CoA carboxylase carboxyltransferase subunit beta [Sphingobacteriales bacterium]MBP9141264.1 acetyl-CoA carboxylase carboxyltransferase subunit beta [Chitinophagales bacterium]MDA0197928.1 acetyl-CoA carboxylase, carboxyltransferase subunit beta [Bacteroidota bacterium]MBK7526105.1 acetyl-CoA carboxylase carboxyltransferase subunit beta [Sphingobacteriales bacterium]MBK8677820.1 acetyl-CoA carboxylase carboxyltransferase subunit beta [Sphingobacteriales bacterium]
MSWYKRIQKNIFTRAEERKSVPDKSSIKCDGCGQITMYRIQKANLFVCQHCGYHDKISSDNYFEILFDEKSCEKIITNLQPVDFLGFNDSKPYAERLVATKQKTQLDDAMQVAVGRVEGHGLVVACMDFEFIGGSMGSVVGEKISRAIDHCLKNKLPLLIISKSGGARMMESAFSLMQMAKTSAKLTLLSDAKLPYISLMTNPTTGGVSASFAMLGDVNMAEPKALIGFAGPRVVKETIKRDLPEGFQTAEFLLDHGFLDMIVPRSELKSRIVKLLMYFKN